MGESLKAQIKKTVGILAAEKIDRLDSMWKTLFEPEIGDDHMRTLVEHVDAFFSDIITETEQRTVTIRKRIDDLNREKQELKRLLKEDVEEVNTANVPLLSLQMNIDESLKELRRKLEERYKEIEELRSESVSLCATMDEVPRPIVKDPLPSERELEGYRTYLDELRDQQFNRYGKILEYRDQIKNIMQKLEITSISEYDNNLLHSNELKPTILNIEKLEQLHETCVDTFERMEYQIKDFRKRLAQLWKYLDVSESHQQKFEKCSETSQTNFDILANEVKRCEQIKRENIKVFIERVRAEIEEYWNKCLKSEAERMLFKSFNTNIFNEDVLELHEDELRDLKQFYENNEPIFKLINERNDLWNQLEVLQNKEQDPKRYNNRGGQLLKEEKERKMLTLKLPKVVDKLTLIANQYEEVNGRPFTVYGVRVQDMIEKDYETKRQEKLTKSGKKVFPTPLKGTASRGNLTHMRTPLTVEQTLMANRNGLKSTGGRLVAMSRTNLCTTTSSTSSIASTRTDHGKRKFVNSKTPGPPAKRQLQLSPLKTQPPSRVLQPHSENRREVNEKSTVRKPTTIRVYNTGSLVKRKSISRKSIGKKNRRSNSIKLKSKPRPKIPEIVLSDHESENIIHLTDENATSYEGFESYASSSKKVLRSSVIHNNQHQKRQNFLAVNHYGFASPISRKHLCTPKRVATPSASTPTQKGLQPKELEFSLII